MSGDAYGVPIRKYDFGGRDIGLAGQAQISGAQLNMQTYLRWSRTDSLACAAGVNAYLPFDVPPLPIGSVIHANVIVTTATAGEIVGLAIAADWLVVPPVIIQSFGSTGFSAAGPVDIWLYVTSRIAGAFTQRMPASVSNGTGAADWGKNNRMAVYGTEASALVIAAAFVEVFIPRAYR